ncbi:hypothetical protein B296_00007395 [Ensete ventricosum]|uniref:Uncharacterized protein n=1 Tax=Ensete ventricosum TaxID=4639 RepID=A0A427AX43_ENSVE|nr:hypothetical protein B296_00007395 [Ensete ventricosum]
MHAVSFRSIFRAPSQNFKILAISNILAHGTSYDHSFMKNAMVINFALVSTAHKKSYEHGFTKKCDDHKLCVKSRFNQFFVNRLGIPKH